MVKKGEIRIPDIKFEYLTVGIEGETPLLMQRYSETTRKSMEDKYEKGVISTKKIEQSMEELIEDKIHRLPDGTVGFPVSGFANGMIAVAPRLDVYKNLVTSAVSIFSEYGDLVPIKYKEQVINETWGRKSGMNKTPYTIYRPEFRDWSCTLSMKFDASVITAQQITSLLEYAGFHQGIGSWRHGLKGIYGMYHIEKGDNNNGGERKDNI